MMRIAPQADWTDGQQSESPDHPRAGEAIGVLTAQSAGVLLA